MTSPDEVKDKFYDDLANIISATPSTEKRILISDFNARVGTDHQNWELVIGSKGLGKCNSNGLLLLRKCTEHDLLITNTVFIEETSKDEKSVVYSHLNEIPNKFVVKLRNAKTGFLRCIGYPSFIKDHIKLGSLQILALVQLQNFQNYQLLVSPPSKLKL